MTKWFLKPKSIHAVNMMAIGAEMLTDNYENVLYTCCFSDLSLFYSFIPVCDVDVPFEPLPDPEPREPPDSPDPEPEAFDPVPDLASSCSSRSSSSLEVDRVSWFPESLGASP